MNYLYLKCGWLQPCVESTVDCWECQRCQAVPLKPLRAMRKQASLTPPAPPPLTVVPQEQTKNKLPYDVSFLSVIVCSMRTINKLHVKEVIKWVLVFSSQQLNARHVHRPMGFKQLTFNNNHKWVRWLLLLCTRLSFFFHQATADNNLLNNVGSGNNLFGLLKGD